MYFIYVNKFNSLVTFIWILTSDFRSSIN